MAQRDRHAHVCAQRSRCSDLTCLTRAKAGPCQREKLQAAHVFTCRRRRERLDDRRGPTAAVQLPALQSVLPFRCWCVAVTNQSHCIGDGTSCVSLLRAETILQQLPTSAGGIALWRRAMTQYVHPASTLTRGPLTDPCERRVAEPDQQRERPRAARARVRRRRQRGAGRQLQRRHRGGAGRTGVPAVVPQPELERHGGDYAG